MITFISEEYTTINRETQEPVIRESVKYRWSSKTGGKCRYTPDMNQTLSDEDMTKFRKDHEEWNKSQQIDSEDSPFL